MKPTAIMNASRSDKDIIRNLMGLLRLQARLEANQPTFSKFLGLSVSPTETDDVDKEAIFREDRFSFLDRSGGQQQKEEQQSLVFRYRLPPKDRLRYLDEGGEENRTTQNSTLRIRHGPSLSTYTSILDDVTTLCIISATPKYSRPGVSVAMKSQWGPGAHASGSSSPEEVDIVTTITKKGRTLAFVRAEVRDPTNDDGLICYFDHIKYLPTGWIVRILLSPVGIWCLDLFSRYVLPYLNKGSSKVKQNNIGIMDSFQQTSDTTATFRSGPQHSNGLGGLHGGVHAVLMERLGRTVARKELLKVNPNASTSSIHNVECEQLQISYQSSASRAVEVRAHVIDPPRLDRPSITLRIEILRLHKCGNGDNRIDNPKQSKKVVVSEGILCFAETSLKTKDQ